VVAAARAGETRGWLHILEEVIPNAIRGGTGPDIFLPPLVFDGRGGVRPGESVRQQDRVVPSSKRPFNHAAVTLGVGRAVAPPGREGLSVSADDNASRLDN